MRAVGSAIELENRRKDAVRRIRAGGRVADVANDLGVSRVTVSKWKKTAIEGGLRALNAVPQHVLQSRMSSEQKRQLKKILIGGALARGYPTDLWTCDRIAHVVLEEFGVSYNSAHLGRVLLKMGYSCQKTPVVHANTMMQQHESFEAKLGNE
ncbi:helix-turn-helix domain-containing protein [Novipirellula rosea]|uniref:Winged helix-turn helix domain-containing protein n=1 Tax=Novipirellula rosea TaxID=1031540 RepID=A0ABP8MRA6_9BACT